MNIPIVFKPIYVYDPFNEEISGYYVDGGMLNNYPIHAFDEVLTVNGRKFNVFNNKVLGFRLSSGKHEEKVSHPLKRLIGDLLGTLLHPSEEGQIRSKEERENTIELIADPLSVLNFNPTYGEKYGAYGEEGPIPRAKRVTLEHLNRKL